jgi:nucleoside-diphosphate-sugar epimerase
VCEPFHISPPIYRRRVDFFTKSRSFDIRRATTLLGFSPAVGIREGVRRTADWYRKKGLL